MSPRKPAALRDGDGQDLREYLIATAARLLGERGSAGLGVRDIAREAQVSDGVLYNYFEDKEDLLAHALLAHVGTVMSSRPRMPPAGTGTVADNLRLFIDMGLGALVRVVPAFAGLLSQPKVLMRFHAMVGGDAAFAGEAATGGEGAGGEAGASGRAGTADEAPTDGGPGRGAGQDHPSRPAGPDEGGPAGLPAILDAYLRAEQRLGRIDQAADIDAAVTLVVGAIHGQILPRVLFSPPGGAITTPPDLAGRLAETVLSGIAPPGR
jgi:AcrR family transcriptional regulator